MSTHSDPLAEVVAATLEVAAESGDAGAFTGEVARTLSAVVRKVAARGAEAAELRGFVSGWQEAVSAMDAEGGPAGAQVYRIHRGED
ncbi:hypothetical protein CTZ27_27550 [Streptomyces griseocarneus]|nr:hypothetical protein CTZ27_27550 [Streptomyces griseocarneus]